MPTHSQDTPRPLPDRPDLRHLKNQAKDLFRAGDARSLTDAQFKIARLYGFASWPKLKAHVDSLEEIGQLKHAIDTNDFEGVKTLMSRNPALHGAPLGYNKNGPLTWVAECRVPWEPPSVERLAMAKWMIDNGSDVHQGGDGPLMRAALFGHRIPMMELLVSHGADVNAEWNGYFPILFAPARRWSQRQSNSCWSTVPIRTAPNRSESIRARRWITSSPLTDVRGSSVLASNSFLMPVALPNTTCLRCWTCSAAGSIIWRNCLMPTLRWSIGNSRN